MSEESFTKSRAVRLLGYGLFVLLLLFGAIVHAFWDYRLSIRTNLYCITGGPTDNELTRLFDAIALGDTVESTVEKASTLGNGFLRSENVDDVLVISTPMQWNAKNGILYVEHKDGKVLACRMRTLDSHLMRRDGWPADKE